MNLLPANSDLQRFFFGLFERPEKTLKGIIPYIYFHLLPLEISQRRSALAHLSPTNRNPHCH